MWESGERDLVLVWVKGARRGSFAPPKSDGELTRASSPSADLGAFIGRPAGPPPPPSPFRRAVAATRGRRRRALHGAADVDSLGLTADAEANPAA